MPQNSIYVIEEGAHDYSRWLTISLRPGGMVLLQLADLCHPGMLSALKSVSCEIELIRSSLANGALQITVPNGYFLANRNDEELHIEFRSYDDAAACKVVLKASEVEDRLNALQAQLTTTLA